MKTAILVDGGFFIKRYRSLTGDIPAKKVARDLYTMCLQHVSAKNNNLGNINPPNTLYRIFFYDCAPVGKLVDQIILIAGDSDFVPAAKLARREGIDFVLDPMWNHVNPDLHEHIDGLKSTYKPSAKKLPEGVLLEMLP